MGDQGLLLRQIRITDIPDPGGGVALGVPLPGAPSPGEPAASAPMKKLIMDIAFVSGQARYAYSMLLTENTSYPEGVPLWCVGSAHIGAGEFATVPFGFKKAARTRLFYTNLLAFDAQ